MNRALVHIGYHKSGSTWLQSHLFHYSPIGFSQPMSEAEIQKALIYPNPLTFCPNECQSQLQPFIEQTEGIAILSDERLSGHPDSGGYDSLIIAERIAKVLPDARVLIVLREQIDVIRSAYYQHVRFGGHLTLEQYLKPPLDSAIPRFNPGHYEYHRLVEAYYRLFGRSNVRVLPFELLKSEPPTFVSKITSFVGTSEVCPSVVGTWSPKKTAFDTFRLELYRISNKFDTIKPRSTNPGGLPVPPIRKALRGIGKLGTFLPKGFESTLKAKLRQQICSRFRGKYAESNRSLATLVDWNPEEYGYET